MDRDLRPANKSAKSLSDKQSTKTTPVTEVFRTPEQVAADEAAPEKTLSKKSTQNFIEKLKLKWPLDKREWLVSAVVVIICGSITAFVLNHTGSKPVAVAEKTRVQRKLPPTTVPSTLSGLPVDPAVNQRPVTGVMIENSLDARPQSGLADASVVFEAIAEGGITRFLALFQDTAPTDIGPIRSARPYYAQWAMGFDAGYAHVGGSPEALNSIKAWGTRDLDQFFNAGAYHRIASRAAPHNVYSSVADLNQLETAKGYNTSVYNGFARKAAAPSKQAPAARTIDLKISGPLYNVHYEYDPASNTYKRSEGGAAHIDANGNRQISPSVLVALVTPYSLAGDGYHSQYQVIGSGQVFVFQDGNVTVGNWSKTDLKQQLTFTDAAGKPLKLNPGQTWLTAIQAGNVAYGP